MTEETALRFAHLAIVTIRSAGMLLDEVDRSGLLDETQLAPEDLEVLRERRRAAAERTRGLTPVPGPGGIAGD